MPFSDPTLTDGDGWSESARRRVQRAKAAINALWWLILLVSVTVAAIRTLFDFSNKAFQQPILITFQPPDLARVTVEATSMTGRSLATVQVRPGTISIERTYVSSVRLLIRGEQYPVTYVSIGQRSHVVRNGSQIATIRNAQGARVWDITSRISSPRSAVPRISSVINWAGDGRVLLSWFLHFATCAFAWLLSILVLATLLPGADAGEQTAFASAADAVSALTRPILHRDLVRMAIPLVSATVALITIIAVRGDYPTGLFVAYAAYKVLLDSLLFLSVVLLAVAVSRKRILGSLVAFCFVYLVAQDVLIYYFGNTLFERPHLDLIAPYAIMGFATLKSVLLAVPLLGLAFVAARSCWNCTSHTLSFRHGIYALTAWFILSYAGAPAVVAAAYSGVATNGVRQAELSSRIPELKHSLTNSVLNFCREVLVSTDVEQIRDLRPYSGTIARYHLALGQNQPSSIGLPQFRRIILVTTESLSLDLLSAYNEKIQGNDSAFYGSHEVRSRMFTNYRTTSHNTTQGLVVTLTSHPNFEVPLAARRFPTALPNILRDRGYSTVFVQSDSKYYGGEHRVLSKLGFQTFVAREEFEKRAPNLVADWGAYDRLVYDEVIRQLESAGSQKMFIMALGVDTHPPFGREHVHAELYPPPPAQLQANGAGAAYLGAVWRHDYDLGVFIRKLEARHLLREDTLVILTADHACPFNSVVAAIDGYPQTSLARIPLVFLSGRKLPSAPFDAVACQLDLAPSILHLLGFPVPAGYWGRSLFAAGETQYVGFDRGVYYIEGREYRYAIDRAAPRNPEEVGLLKLAGAVFEPPVY